ncbi:MAG: type IV toxin-antitoxin system AbiEi family antitoxin domain-containing protein [Thermoanaerobacter sp.]|nr:type IV toxin-antitoxin system AbiEi family antitoxin domain-containing protein [Thermoanaerobacter sp.]
MGNQQSKIVSTSELAEILGITDRRIRQLEKAGIISKLGRGKFDLAAAVQQYISWLKAQAAETDEELDLKKEKTLLTRANRQKAELELQIMRGELHRSEDVRRVMNDMLGAFRARCLAIPTKAAPRLQGQTDLAVIQDIIKKEVYEALMELSDYDPEVFYARSKDKLAIEDEVEKEEEPSAKETPRRGRQKAKK